MNSTRRVLSRSRRGFTLVEIILVVAIIMTLVGMVGPRLAARAKRAKINATHIEINNVKTALGDFEVKVGRFPTTAEGLKALVEKPNDVPESVWQERSMDSIPKDAWGKEFHYVQPSSKKNKDYDLISAGPDGKFDSSDDITNDIAGSEPAGAPAATDAGTGTPT